MEVIGIKEVVELTGLSDKYVRHLVACGEIKALPRHKGEKVRIPKLNVERWLYGYTQAVKKGV